MAEKKGAKRAPAKERPAPKQRVVWADGQKTYGLAGETDHGGDDHRGELLPALLSEGWEVETVVGVGGGGAYFVLRQPAG